jgi:hypothetical protein
MSLENASSVTTLNQDSEARQPIASRSRHWRLRESSVGHVLTPGIGASTRVFAQKFGVRRRHSAAADVTISSWHCQRGRLAVQAITGVLIVKSSGLP